MARLSRRQQPSEAELTETAFRLVAFCAHRFRDLGRATVGDPPCWAADVAQQTWARLLKQRAGKRGGWPRNLPAYLRTVAASIIKDHLKQERHRRDLRGRERPGLLDDGVVLGDDEDKGRKDEESQEHDGQRTATP